MKKLLLIPSLLISTLAFAQDYKYEITPVVGYNISEGNTNLENQLLLGVELQYNTDTLIKPELSVLYSNTDYEHSNKSTNIYRIALNGVYEYKSIGFITPLAKAGIGYETLTTNLSENHNSPFLDAGIGAKIPFTEAIALKLEAIYMLKHNDNRWDNNMALLAGLNFAFGKKAQREIEKAPEPKPIDGDDDRDGVLNSIDVCPLTRPNVKVNNDGCFIDGDDDKDGVLNSVDACQNTPAGKSVNAKGCFVDEDDDKDGVLNSADKCPTTPLGNVVNSDGCTKVVNLSINFKTGSYSVDSTSKQNIQKFADFLKDRPEFSAQIIGHTDSVGTKSNNQKLSQNRANTVKNMIIEAGNLDSSRVSAVGMGEDLPKTSNQTAQGRSQNRRIEAILNRK
jgi:OOP family OmpA-OmpF porin